MAQPCFLTSTDPEPTLDSPAKTNNRMLKLADTQERL
jgi:hypothetical protein